MAKSRVSKTTRKSSKSVNYSPARLIAKKRDGGALSTEEIVWWIGRYVTGEVTDYQMSAMAMAIYFQGMTPAETATLTLAMRDSGEVIDLSGIDKLKVDKHSTGGVGDKVSICLAPLVAACGVPVPMISGRGLGHTGGTLDKLEAIPGFRTDMSNKKFAAQVAKIGTALYGQTGELAPADKKLYALRDVTGTVESVPLITASILSKKLAEGIDALVMDVKVGRGAFMKDLDSARVLARSIMNVGKLAGKKVSVLITRMDAPLGYAIGNANETAEALEVLHGGGPEDLVECTMALGAEMLRLGGVARTEKSARRMLKAVIDDGTALDVMEKVVRAQKGDARVVRDPSLLPIAKCHVKVKALKTGYVRGIDALELGHCGVTLGAGRMRADQAVDPAVGIVIKAKPGTKVASGDTVAVIQVHDRKDARAVSKRVAEAFEIGRSRPKTLPLVIETMRR